MRALIHEIRVTVEREAATIEAQITWEGGAKTELAPLHLRRQGQTYHQSTPEDTVELVRRLAAHYDDQTIALVLAKQKRRTTTGLRFTKRRVAQLRNAHGIPAFAPAPAATSADGELLGVRDVAAELDVTPATVYRWLRDGFIAGEQPAPGAPWRIRLNAELRAKVAEHAPDGWLPLADAATPSGFRFVPFPNDCAITVAGHRVFLKAVILDNRIGQVVAEIVRDLLLDQKAIVHELLRVQDVYRGVALSYVLLNQAFPL